MLSIPLPSLPTINMTSASDWLHFHQANHSAAGQGPTPYAATSASDLFFSGRASEATVVSTTNTNPSPIGPAHLGPNNNRVTKPARKRTRASRRTPTTLLNTDTTNFRAMVQQFTGGPSNTFEIPGPGLQMFGNGMGRGYGLNHPMGQLQQGLSPIHQYAISSNNNNNNSNIMFMQRNNNTGEIFSSGENNMNMNVRLAGATVTGGGGSSSSENRSIDDTNFHF